MKIIFFMLPLLTRGGGAEKYFIELARNLNNEEIQVDIVTMDRNFFKKFARLLYIFYHFNFLKPINIADRETEKNIKENLGKANWIQIPFKDLKKTLNNYDIIYSKNEIVDLFLLKLIGYKNLPPIIVGVHTPIFYPITKSLHSKLHNFLYLGFIYEWLLSGIKCVHLSNLFTKDLVARKFRVKTELINYPFSVDDMERRVLENVYDYNFDNKKLNIVFIARLTEQKGINDLSDIIIKLSLEKDLISNVCINIFGSGDRENLVKDLALKYDFVKYFGHIENKYVPNILSKNDLFISTAKWETLPFNILEAQAIGLPVIAFNISGPSDIIINNTTGYLVGDKKEFLEKILKFKKDYFNRNDIIKNIENKFNPNIIYKKILNMFKENCN